MAKTRARDAKGRTWTVELRFPPWRRVVRPMAYMIGDNPRRKLSTPPPPPPPSPPKTFGDRVIEILLAPLAYHEAIGPALLWLIASPVIAAELVALGIGGAGLAVARGLGLARHRIDVIAHTDVLLHSETILLVRGRERALEVATEIAEGRVDAAHSYQPDDLPDDVTVRLHRSIWQSSSEWVGRH